MKCPIIILEDLIKSLEERIRLQNNGKIEGQIFGIRLSIMKLKINGYVKTPMQLGLPLVPDRNCTEL